METFEDLRRQGSGTLLVISHQERILSIADEIVVIADGRVKASWPEGGDPSHTAGGRKGCDLPLGKGGCFNMNAITEKLLGIVSDFKGSFQGAFNIRENGQCAGRQSSPNIHIESKTDRPGIDIHVLPGTKGETVYIPACVTHGDVNDLRKHNLYFFIGKNADVRIVAGCGVHTENEEEARHNGIHRFFLEKGARVVYEEKHVGTGKGTGAKRIDPVTEVTLDEDAYLEMDTVQLGGVDSTVRKTSGVLGARAKLIVRERIMTDGEETAKTDFKVTLKGEDSGVDLMSRSVAKGHSHQEFISSIRGENRLHWPFGMRRYPGRRWYSWGGSYA